ncbi:MAG: hypothetical protein M5U28_07565 [Sandaracinaceae bacterium]|nr:hypothetical protein [Sandaracinaceae bacterium]
MPLGFMTMLMGAFMCDAPGSSLTLCAAVAYGPPGVLVVVGTSSRRQARSCSSCAPAQPSASP